MRSLCRHCAVCSFISSGIFAKPETGDPYITFDYGIFWNCNGSRSERVDYNEHPAVTIDFFAPKPLAVMFKGSPSKGTGQKTVRKPHIIEPCLLDHLPCPVGLLTRIQSELNMSLNISQRRTSVLCKTMYIHLNTSASSSELLKKESSASQALSLSPSSPTPFSPKKGFTNKNLV